AAAAAGSVALIPVGNGQALVLGAPPLSAWARSADGDGVDIFVLIQWSTTNTDALIDQARKTIPTSSMKDLSLRWSISEPGLTLIAATDVPGQPTYDEHRIAIAACTYRVLEGVYKTTGDEVHLLRLKPLKADGAAASATSPSK